MGCITSKRTHLKKKNPILCDECQKSFWTISLGRQRYCRRCYSYVKMTNNPALLTERQRGKIEEKGDF